MDGIGVEINAESAEMGKLQGVKILQKDISEFALNPQEIFDVVCNFQVVEHNADIYHFILSNIACLKPGGLLMMSVPDSSSLLNRNIMAHALNLPPHHMSLWNKHTLSKLPTIYKNLRIKAIFHEPLQEYHFDLYCKEFFNTFIDRYWGWRSFIYRTGLNKVIRYSLKRIRPNLKGHTLLAVYQKI